MYCQSSRALRRDTARSYQSDIANAAATSRGLPNLSVFGQQTANLRPGAADISTQCSDPHIGAGSTYVCYHGDKVVSQGYSNGLHLSASWCDNKVGSGVGQSKAWSSGGSPLSMEVPDWIRPT